MHLALLVPAPWDTVSGGYAYDRRIVAGLRAAGHTVDVVELPGHPLADDTARDAAHTALQTLAPSARPVIDGLALPAFASMEDALQARQAVALIHQPVSLEPGVSERGQAALHAIEQRLLPRLARIIVTSEATASPSSSPAPTTRRAPPAPTAPAARSCRWGRSHRARGTTCC